MDVATDDGVGVPTAKSMSYTPDAVTIDLCPYTVDRIVPGSLRFVWMGTTYEDFEGVLYRDRSGGNPGIISGRVDYAAGQAIMSDYVVGPNPDTVTLLETWDSLAHLQAHFQAPHMKAFVEAVRELRVASSARVVRPA